MKKLLAICLFVMGFTIASHAQDSSNTTKQQAKKEERKKMMADLNLNADQKKQMKDVNNDFKDKAKAIKDDQSLSKKDRRAKFASLAKERTDKMNSFLSPDQQAKLKEDKKEGRKKKA